MQNRDKKFYLVKTVKILIGVALALLIFQIKPTETLTFEAIRYLGIFAAFVFWLLSGAMSDVACALVALTSFTVFGVSDFGTAFGQFNGSVVWTILTVFAVANTANETGIFKRIALNIIKLFPAGYKGQVAAVLVTGSVLCPMIPSTNAKAAIMGPLAGNIIKEMGYKAHSNGAAGLASALWIAVGSNAHCTYTGSPNVLLMLGVLGGTFATYFNFGNWLLACSVGLIISLVCTFFCIQWFYKPEVDTKVDKDFVPKLLRDMGPMSGDEKYAAGVLVCMLILWCLPNLTGLSSVTVAIMGVLAFMFKGLLTPKQLCTRIPWNLVIWIGGIMGVAGMMNTVGLNTWLSETLSPYLGWMMVNRYVCVICVCIVTYLLRTVVNSPITVMTILYFILGSSAEAAGIGAFTVCMSCLFAGNCWHTYYNNPLLNTNLASCNVGAGFEAVAYRDTLKMQWCFMIFTILECVASVPLWMMMGL